MSLPLSSFLFNFLLLALRQANRRNKSPPRSRHLHLPPPLPPPHTLPSPSRQGIKHPLRRHARGKKIRISATSRDLSVPHRRRPGRRRERATGGCARKRSNGARREGKKHGREEEKLGKRSRGGEVAFSTIEPPPVELKDGFWKHGFKERYGIQYIWAATFEFIRALSEKAMSIQGNWA